MAADHAAGELPADDDIAAVTRQAKDVLAYVQAQADELRQAAQFVRDLASAQRSLLDALPSGSVAAVASSAVSTGGAVSAVLYGSGSPGSPAYGGGAAGATLHGTGQLGAGAGPFVGVSLSGAGTLSAAATVLNVTSVTPATAKVARAGTDTPAGNEIQEIFRQISERGIAGLTGRRLLVAVVVIVVFANAPVAALELPAEWQALLASEVGYLGLALAIIAFLPRK